VNYLGDPDNGVIVASYLGSWLLSGAFLAVGSGISATTNNQVIAFILTVVVCFLLVLAGFPLVLSAFRSWAPNTIVDAVSSLSFLTHYQAISRGVLDFRDIGFFVLIIIAWLIATVLIVNMKKADG